MATWQAIYASDLQGVYALWIVPLAFLAYLALAPRSRPSLVAPGASPAMRIYALVFALETMLDPLAGGPLARGLGVADGWGGTAIAFLFVLLGDFRVLVLVFYLTAAGARRSTGRPADLPLGRIAARAARWTLVVPLAAGLAYGGARLLAGDLPSQWLWLCYEVAFAALALGLAHRLVPAEVPPAQARIVAYLRDVLHYVALYYALWAAADVLIVVGGLDAGWALRMVPNQLYYGLYVPVAYALFFADRYAASSSSTQAAR